MSKRLENKVAVITVGKNDIIALTKIWNINILAGLFMIINNSGSHSD